MDNAIEAVLSPFTEPTVHGILSRYFQENEAARTYIQVAKNKNWPIILDHAAIRCHAIDERAKEFLLLGYESHNELIEYPDQGWWAKVYRKEGYPSLFIDQAYSDARGEKSILPSWVNKFGDRVLHHVAVRVNDIEQAIAVMKERGVEFSGDIAGPRGTRLRQVFTAAEVRGGDAYSVLELTERNDYDGFYPEQADSLMQSSTKTKSR